jgi:hypothetical protein
VLDIVKGGGGTHGYLNSQEIRGPVLEQLVYVQPRSALPTSEPGVIPLIAFSLSLYLSLSLSLSIWASQGDFTQAVSLVSPNIEAGVFLTMTLGRDEQPKYAALRSFDTSYQEEESGSEKLWRRRCYVLLGLLTFSISLLVMQSVHAFRSTYCPSLTPGAISP